MKTRFFPTGSIIVRPRDLPGVEIALYDSANGQCAIGYRGKKTNPDFRYRFDSAARRETYIAKFIADCQKLNEVRAVRRESRKLDSNPVKVGDIFVSSWGYDQTNIDFYQVVKMSGFMVDIRPLRTDNVGSSGDMSYYEMPRHGVFLDPEKFGDRAKTLRKKVQKGWGGGDSVYLRLTSFSSATLWDGTKQLSTHYA